MPPRLVLRYGPFRDIVERLLNDAKMPPVQQKRLLDALKLADNAILEIGNRPASSLLADTVTELVRPYRLGDEDTVATVTRILDELTGLREAASAAAVAAAEADAAADAAAKQAEAVQEQIAQKAAAGSGGGRGGKR